MSNQVQAVDEQAEVHWITFQGERVRVKFVELNNELYINCYTKDDNLFDTLKNIVRNELNYKWHKTERYWFGDPQSGYSFLDRLGIDY